MGFFLFISSFYAFSILFLKAAVSLSHLPVTSDFHLFICKSGWGGGKAKHTQQCPGFKFIHLLICKFEWGVTEAKHQVMFPILNVTHTWDSHVETQRGSQREPWLVLHPLHSVSEVLELI